MKLDKTSDKKEITRAIHFGFKIKAMTPDVVKHWYQQPIRQPLNLDQKKTPRGQLYIILNRCKECNYCIDYCPEDVLALSQHLNNKGYRYPTIAEGKDSACVNCHFCSEICPDFAIYTDDYKEIIEKKVAEVTA